MYGKVEYFCKICSRRMDLVRASRNDQGMFSQCREIVMKFADEQGKPYLPQE